MDLTLSALVRTSLKETGECELPAHLGAVEPSVELLRDFAHSRGVSAEMLSAIELATVEGLNNAIKHAAKGKIDASVKLRWQLTSGKLEVSITDSGQFSPGPKWFEPPDDPLAESGRGGFLMRSLMDQVDHENGPDGHVLRLTKHIGHLEAPRNAAEIDQELSAMTQDLSDSYESLAALFSISTLLATTPEFSVFLSEVLSRLRTLVNAGKAYVRFAGADGVWRMGGLSGSQGTALPLGTTPNELELQAWREQRELTVENTAQTSAGEALRHMAAGDFICPISFANHALGVLVVGRRTGEYFTAGQLNLVRTVGDYLAIACTTSELQKQRESQQRVAREFQIAASIQQSLLPRQMPLIPGWEIEGQCHSANEVGGDYFDIIEKPGVGFLVVIADVMGKGLPAALLAMILRTSVRARLDLVTEPGRLMTNINEQLHADLADLNMFITTQFAWFDTLNNRVLITSAGHCDALVARSETRDMRPLSGQGGVPLGVMRDTVYTSDEFAVEPLDRLLFITDGLYEIEGISGQQLGIDGLIKVACSVQHTAPKAFATALLENLSFRGNKDRPADDRTLVVVQRSTKP